MTRILLAALMAVLAGCGNEKPADTGIDLQSALGDPAQQGYTMATESRAFVFPRDHGAHEGFRNEWWYLTGNLQSLQGERLGYQLTFFRVALSPEDDGSRKSGWATRHVWMAHAAVTAPLAGGHFSAEMFEREALGMAAASTDDLDVRVRHWRLAALPDGAWHLRASTGGFAFDLRLRPLVDPVLQGNDGLSQKSAQPGNASYYYSIPRIETAGTITVSGRVFTLSGLSWLDREWSSSALDSNQVGWDWFSLQFDDGTDIMYYRLRRTNGETDPASGGSVVVNGRKQTALAMNDVALAPVRWWAGPDGRRYPVAWDLDIVPLGRSLRVDAVIDDQYMDHSVKYWEGMISVIEDGEPVGRGYLEMTGY